jgi:hypothetical protein
VIDARDPTRSIADCPAPCWHVSVPRTADLIWGGGGDDLVLARDGRLDVIRCQEGRDTVISDRGDRISPFGDCEIVRRA